MQSDYIEPSQAARLRAAWLIGLAVLAASILQFLVAPRFFAFLDALPICEHLPWVQALLLGLMGVMALVGAWGVWLAHGILRSGQWPAPGAWVLRRTRIRRGVTAKLRAYGLLAVSGLSLSVPLVSWHSLGRAGFLQVPPQCAPNYSLKRTAVGRLR
jgi:hypothetical protein